MSALRCFVAVRFPRDVLDELVRAEDEIRRSDPAWRDEKWVTAERLHITLKFLGDVGPSSLDAIVDALALVASDAQAFDLGLQGLKSVPGARRCRMIWAVLDDASHGCRDLAEKIDAALEPLGIASDARPFNAHATLCRARRPKPVAREALASASALLSDGNQTMSVPTFSLLSSRLTSCGPEYSEIASWPLSGGETG